MNDAGLCARLGIQPPLPVDAGFRSNRNLLEYLQAAAEHKLAFIELNLIDYQSVEVAELVQHLKRYGLRLLNLATGAMAVRRGHALAHPDGQMRKDAIESIAQALRFAAAVAAETGETAPGIILGLVQGRSSAPKEEQRKLFADSLQQLLPSAEAEGVVLVIEATNRFMSGVSHTVEESVEFVTRFDSRFLRVLPDTFHMNIEEQDICAELLRHADSIDELHVSDNNRLYPGYGAIDFRHILKCLDAVRFAGPYVIEGNLNTDVSTALGSAIRTLATGDSRRD